MKGNELNYYLEVVGGDGRKGTLKEKFRVLADVDKPFSALSQ